MKIMLDRADTRGYANHGWLKTYHTFSFANYYNPQRMGFGALRVLNDDTVAPKEGFDTHPHRNMEVISIPLEGELQHGDSLQNQHVITRGDIQVMTAGTGIYHSEFNASDTDMLKFLQIWVIPRQQNLKPQYENYNIRALLRPDELSLFLSPDGRTPASIHQDAWFSWGDLTKGIQRTYTMNKPDNGVYIFVIDGSVQVEDIRLNKRDGMGVWDTESITVEALEQSIVLLIEVPMEL